MLQWKKQKLITKCKCRNTGYNDRSRYLCFHLCFLLILRSQSSNRTCELIRQDAKGAETRLKPSLCSVCSCRTDRSMAGHRGAAGQRESRHGNATGCGRSRSPLGAGKLKWKKLRQPAQSYFAQRASIR